MHFILKINNTLLNKATKNICINNSYVIHLRVFKTIYFTS